MSFWNLRPQVEKNANLFLTLPPTVIYEDPDPLIPEDPKKMSNPDPAPKVAPYPAPGKPQCRADNDTTTVVNCMHMFYTQFVLLQETI